MKVALLMTGECRQLWLAAHSIYKYAIDPNDADVFLYLNPDSLIPRVDNEEEVVNKAFPRNVKSIKFVDNIYKEEVEVLIESNYLKIDGFYKDANREIWDKKLNIHNTDQYLKVKKCCEQAVKYATENNFKYDLIIRMRPDIGWLNKIDLTKPVSPELLYVNYSMHNVSHNASPVPVPWVEDTCFFGNQDNMLKFCSDFSDKMVDELQLCHEKHDLSCATEKLLARVLLNTGIKYTGINDYFGYSGPGWIRPKLVKYHVDWTKSPNFHLIERFGAGVATKNVGAYAVYFDKIGEKNVVMDPTIVK